LWPIRLEQKGVASQNACAQRGGQAEKATPVDASPGCASFFCDDRCQYPSKSLTWDFIQHIANALIPDIPEVTQNLVEAFRTRFRLRSSRVGSCDFVGKNWTEEYAKFFAKNAKKTVGSVRT
jgi:hypothetical protein